MAFGIGLQWNAPEELAVPGVIAGQRIGGEVNDLSRARQRGNDGRRIRRFVVAGFPEHLAGPFVETDQGSAVGAPDRNNYTLAVNDRRSVVAPARRGAGVGFGTEKFDAEILLKTGSPDRFAVRDAEATKFAVARLHINAVTVDQRCAARPGAPLIPEAVGNSLYVFEGITPGWGDVYTWDTPDQFIDISNTPPGTYDLVMKTNPNSSLLVAGPQQTCALTTLQLTASSVKVVGTNASIACP